MFERLEDWVSQLDSMGHTEDVIRAKKMLELAVTDHREFWNEPLTYLEAQAWGGYSVSQLRRQGNEGTVPVTPEGRIRRRHVPVKPGHVLPLGLDSTETGEQNWADRIRERREAS